MSDSTDHGPDWIIKAFAEHIPENAARIIDNMVQASITQQIDGGVLTERSYPVGAIGQAIDVKVGDQVRLTIPETEMSIIPSADVPTGRVHHVIHFLDGDHALFSRVWQEDRNPVAS